MLRDTAPTVIALNGQPDAAGRVAAVYRCKAAFDTLTDTEHPDVKFCGHCRQRVFKVSDFDGLERAVASKGCVWGPLNLRNPARAEPRNFLGGACIVEYDSGHSGLRWDE